MKNCKPTLLLFDDLVQPIKTTISELETISVKINSIPNQDFIQKGTFVYIISLFESSISECLKRYLLSFPEKIKEGQVTGKDSKFLTDTFLASDIIELIIDDSISKSSYENVSEIISKTIKQLNINNIEYNNKELTEIKERRNILVHNNLIIDKKYIRNTKCNSNKLGNTLEINIEYLLNTIKLILDILKQLNDELEIVYGEYDRTKLLKEVWYYTFDSSLLKYDEYWDENHLYIYENKNDIIQKLSSGEKTLLVYWLQHFSVGIADKYFKFSDMHMSVYSMKKMNFLNTFFNRYPFILQHG